MQHRPSGPTGPTPHTMRTIFKGSCWCMRSFLGKTMGWLGPKRRRRRREARKAQGTGTGAGQVTWIQASMLCGLWELIRHLWALVSQSQDGLSGPLEPSGSCLGHPVAWGQVSPYPVSNRDPVGLFEVRRRWQTGSNNPPLPRRVQKESGPREQAAGLDCLGSKPAWPLPGGERKSQILAFTLQRSETYFLPQPASDRHTSLSTEAPACRGYPVCKSSEQDNGLGNLQQAGCAHRGSLHTGDASI